MQWWLAALVMGVAVPVLFLVVVLSVTQVRREQREARQTALRIARATAARMQTMRAESQALLEQIASRPDVIAMRPGSCRSEFAAIDFLPRYIDLFLFDAKGQLVCSAAVDSRSRPWVVHEVRVGRIRPGSLTIHTFGGQLLTVSATKIGEAGTLILLESGEVFTRTAFIPGTILTILDRSGTVVARTEASESWSGRNVLGTRIAQLGLSGGEGVSAEVGLDGISRQYAFVQLRDLGWTLYAGVPSWALTRPVREMILNATIAGIGTAVILAIMTLAFARKIGRPIRALAAAASAVGDGNYVRVHADEGPSEVVALADAFNEMLIRREIADVRMKSLSERLLTVQEEERARIARELHDDLGQSLTALKMDVIGLLQLTEQPPSVVPIRDRILRTLDSTVTSVQRISSELRPSVLDDLGLVAAVEAEARLFEERSGIECEVSVDGDVPTDPDTVTAIYRIVQETLTNVARHANATRTELLLRNRCEDLLLEIRDDGRGVTTEQLLDPLSFGLIGIRERTEVIGGTVQIEGIAGRGTIVSVRIPLSKEKLA